MFLGLICHPNILHGHFDLINLLKGIINKGQHNNNITIMQKYIICNSSFKMCFTPKTYDPFHSNELSGVLSSPNDRLSSLLHPQEKLVPSTSWEVIEFLCSFLR